MPLGKLDRVDARIRRRLARGGTAAGDAALRKERRKAWKASLAEAQKQTNAIHADWVARGMPSSQSE